MSGHQKFVLTNLAELLEREGRRPEDFAKEIGIGEPELRDIMTGAKNGIRWRTVKKIRSKLNARPPELKHRVVTVV